MPDTDQDYERQREALLIEIAGTVGTSDTRVLDAMRKVPRHEFVPKQHRAYAYENRPLPIGEKQTISQPLMVATMTEALDVQPTHVTLEVGAGSGYQAAILAVLCSQVYALERHQTLAATARETLGRLGCPNVEVIVADGSQGYPERAPFDRIMVSAGSPNLPGALLRQLKIGGKMVIPVGDFSYQSLTIVEQTPSGPVCKEIAGCVFVPLIGKYGWRGEQTDPR